MFEQLKSLFSATPEATPGRYSQDDPKVAVAALLVHLVRIDGVTTEDETRAIRNALAEHFRLGNEEVDTLLDAARARDDDAVDLYGFTSVLKAHLPEDERIAVIAMLWQAVYADGEVHEFEDNFVWRVAELLGVSARDRVLLRQKVRDHLKTDR